jgi:hypothetical protein
MEDTRKNQALNTPDERAASAALSPAEAPAAAPTNPALFGAEGCCVREFWAVVERNGTLVRGRNVWRTRRLAQGQYEVVFTGDVSNGAYVATIGRPGIATEPPGEIGVALRCCLNTPETNKGVWVDTHNSNGELSDRAFHLVVHTE